MKTKKADRSNPGYFQQAYPIPGTALHLQNYPAWIVMEDGEVKQGIVQLTNGVEHYVTLNFRVVGNDELFRTKKEAEQAAEIKKLPAPKA